MDFARVAEAKRIVQRAAELPIAERQAYLREACGADLTLRHEVDAYLSVSTEDAALFDQPPTLAPMLQAIRYKSGHQIDHYRIEAHLGEGGMGTVYKAHDTDHNREVALKLLLPHAARFSTREKETLARLNHPNIATLFGSGRTSEGLTYLAMEYVRGRPIDQYCADEELDLNRRLALFEVVCRAVQYAHVQLVAHRDIKPSNICVTENGVPKLLDFGVAKLLPSEGDATLTKPTERPLTIAFCSPEQLDGRETGAATDIYSLGVLLSVLLTGRLPYDLDSRFELYSAIRRRDPTRLSSLVAFARDSADSLSFGTPPGQLASLKLRRQLQGDLDAIVLRALRGQPEERYTSAQELADDVRRYLAHQPVLARKGSWRYSATKFIARHRAAVLASLTALAALATFTAVLVLQQRETELQRDAARREATRAQQVTDFLLTVFEQSDPYETSGSTVTVRVLLDAARSEMAPMTEERASVVEPEVVLALAKSYHHLGLYDDAWDLAREALRLSRRKSRPATLSESLLVLGMLADQRSLPRLGEMLQRQALDHRRASAETHPLDIASSLYSVGVSLWGQGRSQEAEPFYRQALQIRRAYAEEYPEGLVLSLNALALLLERSGRYSESESMYRECLELQETHYGPEHPRLAVTLDNLGQLLTNTNRFDEALPHLERALTVARTALGEHHPNLIYSLHNISFLYAHLGDLPRALEYDLQALALAQAALGGDHPNTRQLKRSVARVLSKLGRFEEAFAILDEDQRQLRSSGGFEPREMADNWRHRARVLYEARQFELAQQEISRALAVYHEGETHESERIIASSKGLLGNCFRQLNRFEDAEPLLLEWARLAPPRERQDALQDVAALYEAWGRLEEAAKFRDLLAVSFPGPH